MTAAIAVCVLGASGRMGKAIAAAAVQAPNLAVAMAVDRVGADGVGHPVSPGGPIVSTDLAAALLGAQVYIDFTSAEATLAAARAATAAAARGHRIAAVIGTTGLDAAARAAIADLAQVAPVVVAANYSLGLNVLLGLARRAAEALGPGWDSEIVELHHRHKRDAPSGTALAIGRAVAQGVGSDYDRVARHGRDGDVGPRPPGEIGVSAVRGGDVIGEHTLYFFGEHERLELTHRASNRSIFAVGALRAATWVVGQPPGIYGMLDVLGLGDPGVGVGRSSAGEIG